MVRGILIFGEGQQIMIIGRSDRQRNHNPHIDLSAVDIKNTVSRTHAEIYPGTGGLLLEDKGSLNGTILNGKRLRPNEPQPLRPLDRCIFGEVAFCFVDGKLRQV
jgi:pSer/pThr/pTyr-binding forkhead associated (FHA) protein